MQSLRSKTRAPAEPTTTTPVRSSPIQALNESRNNKRRTRSQSRSQLKNLLSPAVSVAAPTAPSSSNRRLLPFDLFLINLKYNSSYASSSSSSSNDNANFDMSKLIEGLLRKTDDSDPDLDRKERLILNNQNIQVFLEQLCPHKRHIKLENLKSLNLSQNRIKKCSLMFDLGHSSSIEPENISLVVAQPKINPTKPTVKSSPSVRHGSGLDESSSTKSSESEWSDEDLFSSENDYSSDDQQAAELSQAKLKSKRSRLKDKLATFSPLKKKLADSQTSPAKRKTPFYLNKSEERASMISKLMFPSLTHLDVSSNKLKRLAGSLALLENLSYLNVSSNPHLVRVSPQLGILSKLWNFDLKNCQSLRDPVNLDNLVKQRTKTSDILGYLKSILEHSRPYTRIKLMFVGVQAIGKTSLLNKLRDEGTSSNKQSWSDRVSSSPSNTSMLSSAQPNISTVGIDINEWVYEKPKQKLTSSTTVNSLQQHQQQQQQLQQQQQYVYQMENSANRTFGPITFRTWDFGGQREYYSTHQYFLSKRALYLVCWKLSEEEKGINEIHHWLSNIQTRAPGSPVIIVGTHQVIIKVCFKSSLKKNYILLVSTILRQS